MILTKEFSGDIKVHAIQTGTVAVTKEHFQYSGLGLLRIPKILFGKTFRPEMPVWVWCIETPHGNYLVDTGESTDFYQADHFKEKSEDYVNRRILRIHTREEWNIDRQLAQIGLHTSDIDAVLMTHLHLDHTDGIRFFEKSEFFIPQRDWERPYGVPLSTFPKWFKGNLVEYESQLLPSFQAHTFSKEIKILATPGHTLGHQSILLEAGEYQILFAGDTTFTEEQLIHRKFGGIHLDLRESRRTIDRILDLSDQTKLIYLPSHDPESANRLMNFKTTKRKMYESEAREFA